MFSAGYCLVWGGSGKPKAEGIWGCDPFKPPGGGGAAVAVYQVECGREPMNDPNFAGAGGADGGWNRTKRRERGPKRRIVIIWGTVGTN